MSLLFNQLRKFIANRRSGHRQKATLLCTISFLRPQARLKNAAREEAIRGMTRDISMTHLSVMTGSAQIGSRNVGALNGALSVMLELPGGMIGLECDAIRHGAIETEDAPPEANYLIVARIRRVGGRDRALYTEYLQSPEREVEG